MAGLSMVNPPFFYASPSWRELSSNEDTKSWFI